MAPVNKYDNVIGLPTGEEFDDIRVIELSEMIYLLRIMWMLITRI